MNKKNKFVGLAAAAGFIILAGCNKSHQVTPTTSSEQSSETSSQFSGNAKSSSGFKVFALRRDVLGVSDIKDNYDITAANATGFSVITVAGSKLLHVSGITTILNNTTSLYGVTNASSNFPGRLWRISIATKVATSVGVTTKTGSIPVYLQDIERTKDGRYYYAIEVGTKNIYVSPGTGAPLNWTLVGTLPASLGATTNLCGLDIYNSFLTVYGNGNVPGSPFPNTGTKLGYYARYDIAISGAITFVGAAGTNINTSIASTSDAALLISDDGSINGSFIVIATPSNAGAAFHYYNIPPTATNLPYFLTNATTNFGSVLGSIDNLMDFTYF
jgi:hypothetical protein